MSELNFEVGKFYVDGQGTKWECLKTNLRGNFPIAMTDGEKVHTYRTNGFYNLLRNSPNNIVSEWVEKPIVDWSVMPAWAKFVAMDSGKKWFLYTDKPILGNLTWDYITGTGSLIPTEYAPKFQGDWKESLIERP